MDFDPFGFGAMRKSQDASIAIARKAAPGLPAEHVIPGALVTISPCKCTGDRSYSHDIWEVLSANEGHVSIKKHKPREGDYFAGPHIVCRHEHEFYGAEHVVTEQTVASVV